MHMETKTSCSLQRILLLLYETQQSGAYNESTDRLLAIESIM